MVKLRMMDIKHLVFAVASVTALPMTSAVAETWNLANAYGASTIHGEGNMHFAAALAEASGGEIEVVVHAGGALGFKAVDHFDAVTDGVVEIADTPGAFLGGNDAIFLLSSLPFLTTDVEDARSLYNVAKPEYEAVFVANGQKLLYASPWPASGIWSTTEINTGNDLKSLKIRTFDPTSTMTFASLGASPIQLSWGDVVPQLATGGINAVLTSAEGGVSQNFVEHTPHFTEINYALPLNFVHMNQGIFDGLSPDMQEAVMSAATVAEDRNWQEVIGRTERNYKLLAQAGGQVDSEIDTSLSNELSLAGAVAVDEWLGKVGERGHTLLDTYEAR